jgi:hypothetical protein
MLEPKIQDGAQLNPFASMPNVRFWPERRKKDAAPLAPLFSRQTTVARDEFTELVNGATPRTF